MAGQRSARLATGRRRAASLVTACAAFAAVLLGPAPAVPAGPLTPYNDNFLSASNLNSPDTPLSTGTLSDTPETIGATVQANLLSPCGPGICRAGPPETTTCAGVDYGKTVWYDFYPDHAGQIEIRTAGIPNVIALYTYDPATLVPHEVQCQPGSTYPSNDLSANVNPGVDYTFQVGGRGNAGSGLQVLFNYAYRTNLAVPPFFTRAFVNPATGQPPEPTLAGLQFIGLANAENISAACQSCSGATFGATVITGNTAKVRPRAAAVLTRRTRLMIAATSPAHIGRYKVYSLDASDHHLRVVAGGCLAPGVRTVQTAANSGAVAGELSCPAPLVNPSGAEYVFWKGLRGGLWERWYGGRTWTFPRKLNATGLESAPAVAVQPDGQQDVFWKGPGGTLRETWYGGRWHEPENLGPVNLGPGQLASAPSVGVDSAGDEYVFWQGTDGGLWEKSYSAGVWGEPVPVPAPTLGSAPAVAVRADGEQDVFWRGTDGHLWETSYAGRWTVPVNRGGGQLGSAPSVAVDGTGNEYVVWQGTDGRLWRMTGIAGRWGAAAPVGSGRLGSPPTIAAHANGEQDVFWRGTDGRLWETWFTSRWNTPVNLGFGRLGSAPSAGTDASGKQGPASS